MTSTLITPGKDGRFGVKPAAILLLSLMLAATATASQQGTPDLDELEIKQVNPGNGKLEQEQHISVYLYNNNSLQTVKIQLNVTLPNGTERTIMTEDQTVASKNHLEIVKREPASTFDGGGTYTFQAENLNDPDTTTAEFNYKVRGNNSMEVALALSPFLAAFFMIWFGRQWGRSDDQATADAVKWGKQIRLLFYMTAFVFMMAGIFLTSLLATNSAQYTNFATTYNALLTVGIVLFIFMVVILVTWYVRNTMKTGLDMEEPDTPMG